MNPITFNARPIGGGPLPDKLELFGDWYFEPKINDHRAMLHVPTGQMWNRHGQPFSKADQFKDVRARLSEQWPCIEWLDVLCLGLRVPLGKGSLVILDAVVPDLTWTQRQKLIYDMLVEPGAVEPWAFEHFHVETWTNHNITNKLLSFAYHYETVEQQDRNIRAGKPRLHSDLCEDPSHHEFERMVHGPADPDIDPRAAWLRLQRINKELGCELFEGLVAKKADSKYPLQLVSPEQETPDWVRYRWRW